VSGLQSEYGACREARIEARADKFNYSETLGYSEERGMADYVVKVGKRGELYTPKKLRLEFGLATGDEFVAVVEGEAIILRKRKTILDVLEEEALATVSDVELKEERSLLEKELVER